MQFDIVANDKASGTMQKAEQGMGRFTQNLIGKYTMIAAKAALAVAAAQRLFKVISEAGDFADEAAKLGLTAETYQRLKFAAEDYGASVENIATALKDVNKMLDEAATKGGPNADVLKALGFSQQDIADRAIKAEEVFMRISEAIKEARTEEEKFAIASRIVGDRVAQAMVPILADYENFKKTAGDIKVVTNENAVAFDAFGTKVGKALTTLKNQAVNALGAAAMKLGVVTAEDVAPKAAETPEEVERRRKMRDALLAAGGKPAAPKESGMAVTTLQQIGGGIARGPSALESFAERTANATETLAARATESPAVPPSSTDITKPTTDGAAPAAQSTQASPAVRNMSNAFFRGRSPF